MTFYRSNSVPVGDIRAHYWEQGERGDALVLLHGVGCSVFEFAQNMDALSENHHVYALDLLGHGKTDKPGEEPYTIEHQAQFVLDFMTSVGLESAHLLGWSLGGRLALECAAMKPDRVKSLILVAPGGVDDQGGVILELRLATVPFLGELLGVRPSKFAVKRVWSKAFFDPGPLVTEEFVDKKLEIQRQPGANQAFLKCLRSLFDFRGCLPGPVQDIQKKMLTISTPTLVIWGENDLFISCHHSKVLLEKLPDVHVELFDHCGHAPHLEKVALFHEKALRFLRERD